MATGTFGTNGTVSLSSLAASTFFYFRGMGCDAANNCVNSSLNNFTTSAAATPSSSGGGGGGGGGGGLPASSLSNVNANNKPVQAIISIWGQLRFSYEGLTHVVRVKQIFQNRAILTIESDPVEVDLTLDETKDVDLTADGTADVHVTLLAVSAGSVEVKIDPIITEEQPTEVPDETPEIPEPEPTIDDILPEADVVEAPPAKPKPEPKVDEEPVSRSGMTWWISALTLLIILGVALYFNFRKPTYKDYERKWKKLKNK